MIEVQNIPGKGRGVVATKTIPAGTVIEVAPVSAVPAQQRLLIKPTEVFKYIFVRPLEYSKSQSAQGYLLFGLASFCSHHENPNAYINWIQDEVGLWSNLVTHKEIKSGEEVTLLYTNIDEYSDANSYI